jgi:hypothetical protein
LIDAQAHEGQIDSNIVRNTHFGGFSEDEDEDEEVPN